MEFKTDLPKPCKGFNITSILIKPFQQVSKLDSLQPQVSPVLILFKPFGLNIRKILILTTLI